jgi:phosphate transport system substrate-binding protein
VKAIALSAKEGGECVDNTPENAVSGKFPLSRLLYVYVNKAPNKPLAPLEGEFIRMILSKVGQEVVVKDGYIPLPAAAAAEQLAKIGAGGAGSVAGN